jgi:hypothetical protein
MSPPFLPLYMNKCSIPSYIWKGIRISRYKSGLEYWYLSEWVELGSFLSKVKLSLIPSIFLSNVTSIFLSSMIYRTFLLQNLNHNKLSRIQSNKSFLNRIKYFISENWFSFTFNERKNLWVKNRCHFSVWLRYKFFRIIIWLFTKIHITYCLSKSDYY